MHAERRSSFVLVAAASLVLATAMGIRQTFGLFAAPLASTHVADLGTFALAIALQNLIWGLAQPLAGALADRKGPALVVASAAVLYALGLATVAFAPGIGALLVGAGVLVGLGQAGMTFAVVIAAVSKGTSPERRNGAVAIAAACGSLGQAIIVPLTQTTIGTHGIAPTFVVLALLVLGVGPFGILLARGRRNTGTTAPPAATPAGPAIRAALREPGYLLVTTGFFACGFNLAFVGTHLPGYLSACGLSAGLGASALAAVGLFNVAGSYGFGRLADRVPPQVLLVALYATRTVAILAYVAAPPTVGSTMIFAVFMGLTWLGTVPLTNAVIVRFFGVEHVGVLFGIAFLAHQFGSFLGAWGGGLSVALTGSYTPMWAIEVAVSAFAALVNVPIRLPIRTPA
jgi:MFS family permease